MKKTKKNKNRNIKSDWCDGDAIELSMFEEMFNVNPN